MHQTVIASHIVWIFEAIEPAWITLNTETSLGNVDRDNLYTGTLMVSLLTNTWKL